MGELAALRADPRFVRLCLGDGSCCAAYLCRRSRRTRLRHFGRGVSSERLVLDPGKKHDVLLPLCPAQPLREVHNNGVAPIFVTDESEINCRLPASMRLNVWLRIDA